MLPAQPASKLGSLLRLVLFADWISAQFSLTLDLLSLQSPHPHRPALPPQSRYCRPSLISSATGSHFLYFREREEKKEKACFILFLDHREGWNGMIDSHIYVTLTSITAPACQSAWRRSCQTPLGYFCCFTRQASAPNYPERTALMLDFKAS